MNFRSRSTIFLVLAAATFGIAIVFTLSRFLVEEAEQARIGPVGDFPISETPYPIREPEGFLVHLDGVFLFLSSRSPHPAFQNCTIVWDSERDRFMEPCGGSAFALDGRYLIGPSPRSMDRYQVIVREGEIWVNISEIIPGLPHD